jgi:ligand-binding sensor domain-containing protein
MKRILALFLLLFSTAPVVAQVGHYYMSHYVADQQSSSLSFDITQDPSGFLYIATRTGLKQFDGHNWRSVTSTSTIFTVADESGKVYTGGEDGIGVVGTSVDFSLVVNPVYTEKDIDLFEGISAKGKMVFASEQKLVVLNHQTGKTDIINLPKDEEGFAALFELLGVAYVNTFDGTMYKLEGLKLVATNLQTQSPVLVSSGLNDKYFLVTEDQRLFLFDATNRLREVKLADAANLQSSVVVNGTWVNAQLIALGTLNGGVIFINPNTGKTEQVINYYSGLPDNEVYCMKRDAEGNVWIGHEYGYSCIAPNLPFRSFNHYDGLRGNILCAKTFAGRVYVGTSVGLFVLEKQDQYSEEVFYVDKKSAAVSKNESTAKPEPEQESRKKGFFRFLKKKESQPVVASAPNADKKTTPSLVKVRKSRKVLLNSTYSFKKIAGVESKVDLLIVNNNKLYASGLAGLFEVEDTKALPLVQEPVVMMVDTKSHGIVGATYSNRIFSWQDKKQKTLVEDIHDDISSLLEDKEGMLWLTGVKTLYKLDGNGALQSFAYSNPTHDRTVSMSFNGQPLMVNSSGFYTYVNGAVRVIDSLGKASQFFGLGNNLWYKRNEVWSCIGSFADHDNLEYLNVFSDLRYAEADDPSETLWLVTKNNELYRFYSNQLVPRPVGYPLLVRSVRNAQQYFELGKSVYQVEQNEGELMIEVAQATFSSQQGAQYRFMLEGLDKSNWSEWTNNNQLSFPYLPLGSYVFKLQTRDILGNVNELEPIKLKIEPPFWKTPWFYGMEVCIFAVLVILSIRLQAMDKRYRIVAQLLSMLTIVLLITLIQATFVTYLLTTSPVTDFAIQVGVALLVLPVESLLRKVMFSTSEKNKLYQFINPSLKKQIKEEELNQV